MSARALAFSPRFRTLAVSRWTLKASKVQLILPLDPATFFSAMREPILSGFLQDPQFECVKIEVCTSKDCRRRGGKQTLAYFQALAAKLPVEIIETDECW